MCLKWPPAVSAPTQKCGNQRLMLGKKYLIMFAKLSLEKGLRLTQEIPLQDTSVRVFSYSRDDFFFFYSQHVF